jgi:hypothetical protein
MRLSEKMSEVKLIRKSSQCYLLKELENSKRLDLTFSGFPSTFTTTGACVYTFQASTGLNNSNAGPNPIKC